MILFIGHEASRTGAPKVLYDLLSWLNTNKPEILMGLILRKGGERESDFSKILPTQVWKLPYPKKINLWQQIDNKFFDTFSKNQTKYIRQFEKQNIKLIFSNTCTNGKLLEQLSYLKCPIITYIHEMESVIRIFNENGEVTKNINLSSHIITPSKATKNNLIKNHGVESQKISVCYGAVDKDFGKNIAFEDIREKLNIPKDAFVVGACGTVDTRKGADLFLQLAYMFQKKALDNIYFVWAGAFHNSVDEYRFRNDAQLLGLKNQFFLGKYQNTASFYQNIDIFLSISREDPFPLVNLEAGFFEKPIICFQNSGGSEELVDENLGFAVPYLDLEIVMEKILFLKNNPTICIEMGKNLAQKIQQQFISTHTLPKIWEVIQNFLS